LLKLAGLARSTFYYQLKAANAVDKHQALKQQIRAVFSRHQGRYGYRRIALEIRRVGQRVNHKTVQTLMGELGLKSLVRPKKYRSYKGEVGQAAPNILQRQFEAEGPNQKWVTDVTEFNVAGEKLYLSPVMDLYNGEIIAFETANRPVFELVGFDAQESVEQIEDQRSARTSFRSRLAISHAGLPACTAPETGRAEHVTQRQLPRQCRDGKLLCRAEVGVLLHEQVCQRR
jgi:putative transposase